METRSSNQPEPFWTADFGTICTLCHLGYEPTGLERDARSPGRVHACFLKTSSLAESLRALQCRELSVEPLAFLETTRAVKARLRDCT